MAAIFFVVLGVLFTVGVFYGASRILRKADEEKE